MKNKMLLTLSIVGIAGLLVSCNTTGNTSSTGNTSTSTSTPSLVSSSTTPISSTTDKVTYKQGLGTSIDFATDKNGVITQANVYVASVIFDSTNTIVSAYIDELQIPLTYTAASGDTAAKLEFTAGKPQIKSSHKPEGQAVASKKELLEDYGMAGSATKGEWYVQAAAIENVAIGLTVDQFKAQVGTNGKPADGSDLSADASITVSTTAKTIESALAHAKEYEAKEAGVAGAGIVLTGISNDYSGNWQLDVEMAATAVSDSKVVSTQVSVYQIPVTTEGKLGTNNAVKYATEVGAVGTIASKLELGEKYGMAGSANKGEWNVQALAYETWAVGKDAAALNAAVGKDNKPSDSDLAADVSITVNGFTSSVVESLTHVRKDSYK
ncbi:MAG TPA: hypothetical protein DHU62_02405 [Firmicutes bacterium]|nr:hypothetical protein [Bacillota bacterium]